MQDNRPDRPDVITLPPLILAATIALGVVLNFFWPASLLPSALAAPLGILVTLGAIALGISAAREMFAANTPLDVRNLRPRLLPRGSFERAEIPFISACFYFAPALLFSQIRYGFWFSSCHLQLFCKKA